MNVEQVNEVNQEQEYFGYGFHDLVLNENEGRTDILTKEQEQEFDVLLKEIQECIQNRQNR